MEARYCRYDPKILSWSDAEAMGLAGLMAAPPVLAFGLVAFSFLGMGPVTIAVDSYGPVTDNAQSVYELSMIETIPNVSDELRFQTVSTGAYRAVEFIKDNIRLDTTEKISIENSKKSLKFARRTRSEG